ncbi:Glycine-rich protein family [Hirschfeldia incana]|nr:Glycine-rich protein family [Hirschfeldia incana]
MDPTGISSQEHDGGYVNITQCSNPAGDENVDHPSADEVTNQTDVSPPQVTETNKECGMGTGTDTTQETSRNDDGSETENDVGKETDLEKDHEGSWSNVEDKKGHENVLKEIQMQKTHDLYCSNCTHNITGTAKLFEKGQETSPYNIDRFVFVIIFSFKYPFIYLPWLYNNQEEPVTTIQPETLLPPGDPIKTNQPPPPEEPVKRLKTDQPITEHVSPKESVKPIQSKPLLHNVPPVPKPAISLATLREKIREKILPNRFPRLTPTSKRFLLFLVLLLLAVILLLTLPSRPSPPPPPPRPVKPRNSTETDVQTRPGEKFQEGEGRGDNDGSISFSWLPTFLSGNYVSILLLLFVAILAVLWRSMIEGSENGPQETIAATNRPELDDGTGQAEDTNLPVTEITPEENPNNNESQTEDSPNKEGDTSKVLSRKLLPIDVDILKSIVYGGLVESITSFGVVSSAAASGTSTLNVLALGLANLFSGLFIIIHNLYGLFKRPRYQSWNNDHMPEQVSEDPYEELLGKRNRVILHCVVVLVSFIFFGVIPPLFYGFSFKITDNGYYQEVAIFVAASLICVISLSFAKAYAFGMDKLKTVAAYTGIAIGGSALSFVASQQARDVFAKYDFHKLVSDYLSG